MYQERKVDTGESIVSRAASDRQTSAEDCASLLAAENLPAPTPDGKSTTGVAAGIEL
jgi:hypothetical protein